MVTSQADQLVNDGYLSRVTNYFCFFHLFNSQSNFKEKEFGETKNNFEPTFD